MQHAVAAPQATPTTPNTWSGDEDKKLQKAVAKIGQNVVLFSYSRVARFSHAPVQLEAHLFPHL